MASTTLVDRPPVAAAELAGRPALAVEGVTKAYRGQPVLHDVSLTVAQGEIFGLLGSNGAGKTTTVEIVQGIRSRDGGRVRLLGLDPATERSRLRHLVGAQLQSSALPDRLRVGEALRLFARLAGDVVDWRTLRDDWSLGHLERRPFAALSGGERQRLFLALALVNRPRIVFLDELTQGLDVAARRETWDLVEHVRDEGTTVVLVTHFMDEAERLCDRVGVLHGGRVVANGRPAELVAATGGPVRIGFTCPDPTLLAGLDRIPGVLTITTDRRPAPPATATPPPPSPPTTAPRNAAPAATHPAPAPNTRAPHPAPGSGPSATWPAADPNTGAPHPAPGPGAGAAWPAPDRNTGASHPAPDRNTGASHPAADPKTGASHPAPGPGAGAVRSAGGPGGGAVRPAPDLGAGAMRPATGPGAGAVRPAADPGVGASRPAADLGVGATWPGPDPGAGAVRPTGDPGVGASRPAADPGGGVVRSAGGLGGGAGRSVGRSGASLAAVEIACAAGAVVVVVAELAARGVISDDLTVTRPSLEDAFVALTRATGGDDR